MKKLSLFLGMALAASLSLTNCTEKIEGPIAPATPAGIPFEISADISTKTTNNELVTKWATGDAINLFHAVTGTTDYVSDNDFKLDATRDDVFTGNLTSALVPLKSYDWYAFYPYSEYNKTPAGVSKETFGYTHIGDKSQTQEGNNSKAHLCGTALPLYGVAKGLASDVKPKIAMKNLASVVAVKVKNTTTEPLVVKSVSFTSTEDIVGTYYIDFTGENVVYTGSGKDYVSATASLTVNNGDAIVANSEATFFIPIKPHSVKTGSILKISVNGYEKPLTLPKDVTFTAGSIKTLVFDFNKVVVDYVTIPWTEDFSGDLSLYTLVSGGSDTKTYEANLAGGTAPELLVSKNGGSFSAKVKADAGNYVLTFKSNKPDYLTVLSSDKNVAVTKNTSEEYLLTVPEGGSTFTLTIKNMRTGEKDNARIDDISLVADTAVKVPVITVDNTTVSVKPEGDIVTLKYSIKYPAADATITASSADAWVNTFDCTKADEITFAVDANEGEARTVTVTLSYPGAAPVDVTVSQRAAGSSVLVDKTATITFGTNDVKIDRASVTANDDQKNSWTITTVGTDSFTSSPTYYQIGTKNSAATSITFTTILPEDAEVASISAKFGGNKGTAGSITLMVGEASVGTGKLNAGKDVTVTSTSTAVGNKVTITVTGIAKGVKCYNIQVKYKTAN